MNQVDHLCWWKSSRSGNQGQCVEVAASGITWHVRDSKNPEDGQLTVSPAAWQSFLATVKRSGR
jgi:hypothetical protein